MPLYKHVGIVSRLKMLKIDDFMSIMQKVE